MLFSKKIQLDSEFKKNTTLDNINQIKELLISMSEINQIAKQIK